MGLTTTSQIQPITSFTMKHLALVSFFFVALICTTRAQIDDEGGDDASCVDTHPDNCAERVANNPRECYHDQIEKACCKSCKGAKIGDAGCEYGNKASWCEDYEASTCETTPGVKEQCCKLCAGGGEGSGDGEE